MVCVVLFLFMQKSWGKEEEVATKVKRKSAEPMSALHFYITHSHLHCQGVWASRSLTWQGGSPVEGCVFLMSCDLSTLGSHSSWAACRCCELSLSHGFIWPSWAANANLGGGRVWLCCQIPFFAEQLEERPVLSIYTQIPGTKETIASGPDDFPCSDTPVEALTAQ